MVYKGMLLSILLLPAATSYGNSIKPRIQELKESEFQTGLALSKLGAMIAEKDALLRSFQTHAQYLLSLCTDKSVQEIEANNGGIKLSKEEIKLIDQALLKSHNDFLFLVCDLCKSGDILNGKVVNGLFNDTLGVKNLESLRFHLINCACERSLIMKLVERYESCMQELINTTQQIAQLEK